jgi:predicted extracellular nuclease
VTIYDITTRKISEKTQVVLKDVIVTAVDGNGQYSGDMYVQDPKGGPNSGLKLYRPQRVDAGQITDLIPGDHVKVEGQIKYFSPATSPFPDAKSVIELDQGCQVSRLSSGPPPVPAEIQIADVKDATKAAGWENVLVTLKNVGVTKPLDAKYGEFEVGGALAVDDELFPYTPQLGDCISATGILFYFYNYKLAPRDAKDIAAGSGCAQIQTLRIKDLQDETSPNHPTPGSSVSVTAVITAVDSLLSGGASPQYTGFWIADPSGGPRSGIYVYYSWKDTSPAEQKPKYGDLVELTGKYEEYKASSSTKPETVSEITGAAWTSKGPAPSVPAPATVQAAEVATGGAKTEDYEGVLVKVENVEVGDFVLTTGTAPRKVGIKLATSNLYVENELFDFMNPEPAVGTKYTSITGVLQYSFDNFKILPRSASDLVQ